MVRVTRPMLSAGMSCKIRYVPMDRAEKPQNTQLTVRCVVYDDERNRKRTA